MTTVIRLSSLGDVILCGAVTAALGDVAFVTEPRFQGIASRLRGVTRVHAPTDLPPAGRVIDLHNQLRTRRFRADARVTREDLRRRLRPMFKTAPATPLVDRYARAAGVKPIPPPWLPVARRGDALVIAPGAAHATKRWPYFAELASLWPGPVRTIGSAAEELLLSRVAEAARDGAAIPGDGFDATLAALDGAATLVAGDTGLLHLGAAAGLPVVGIFGPTTSSDGFFSYAPSVGAVAVEVDLQCRPCSRFGSSDCPVGDHACLRDLDVTRVLDACLRARALA
jgi:ADP-heptose:LPS heptosyltransferase